jgi:polyhydroxybutyrate depolymerase
MKKILSIIILGLLVGCSFGVQGFSKLNDDLSTQFSSGDHFRFIIVNGQMRSYRLHIPPSYDGNDPVPIVFVLHGTGAPGVNSLTMKNKIDMEEKSDEEGFIVIYPNGEFLRFSYLLKRPAPLLDFYTIATISRMWNCWETNNIDDVTFIRTLINHLETILNIDYSRIFVTGASGGALMTYRLGAELSDIIAAIAPVAGTIGGIDYSPKPDDSLQTYIIPEPSNPLPVIILHGMQDQAIPYAGGWVNFLKLGSFEMWNYALSVNESATFWVEHNNCDPIPDITKTTSERIITRTYTNGSHGSEVILVTYVNGIHEWFYSPPHELSATDLMWEFFEQHPKKL